MDLSQVFIQQGVKRITTSCPLLQNISENSDFSLDLFQSGSYNVIRQVKRTPAKDNRMGHKHLNPAAKLPRVLQWVDANGKLRDRVIDDMNLVGDVFSLSVLGKRLYIPVDLLTDEDEQRGKASINELVKRRNAKLGKKKMSAHQKELIARENRVNELVKLYNVDSSRGTGSGYEIGTTVNLEGLATMTKRYGQVLTD